MEPVRVNFLFYPADVSSRQIIKERGQWAIAKDEGGVKRNYLCGISSGMNTDAHGDYMSESCIKSFQDQAQNKDVLLYVNHGKDFTGDIGRLSKSEIIEQNGIKQWYTEYALYGKDDPVPTENKEMAEHVFRQAAGLPPYKKARQLGFSIEGFIDPSTIQQTAKGREIGFVDLDPGVTIVTKPAYTESIATGIAKALYRTAKSIAQAEQPAPRQSDDIAETTEDQQNLGGEYAIEVTPDNKPKATKSKFDDILEQHKKDDDFYNGKWAIEDALHDGIDQVLESTNMNADQKRQEISDIIDSYQASTIALLDQYGYDHIGQDKPSQSEKTTRGDALAKANNALARLKKLRKGKMEPEIKTVLSDILASLQMLMQAEEREGEVEQVQAAAPKEPEGDEVMKTLIAKMSKLLQKEEGAGSADGKAEDIVEEAQTGLTPDEAEKFEKMLAKMKAKKSAKVDPELVALKSQVNELTAAMENMLKGFGFDQTVKAPEPARKGLTSHTGYELLAKQIAELGEKLNKNESGPALYGEPRTPIQKNRNELMDAFRAAFAGQK